MNARFGAVVGLVLACAASAATAQASEGCPNEARRVEQGSTYLPDCRVYELVTPAEKGATQALSPNGGEFRAIPAEDGERLALHSQAYLGDNPSSSGTNAVFSRGASGWEMTSLQPAGAGEMDFTPTIFTSDLTEVGVEVYSQPGVGEGRSPTQTFEVGPPGGFYTPVATTPSVEGGNRGYVESLVGASTDFSHVVLSSLGSGLLPADAGAAEPGVPNLYDWTGEELHIVNVTTEGKLESECGAVLGLGLDGAGGPHENDTVWSDGSQSKIFFTAPLGGYIAGNEEGPACTSGEEQGGPPPNNPHRLYMRVNDSETVEISAPQLEGKIPCDQGTWSADYVGASADGSEVFFTSESELTPDHTACRPSGSSTPFASDVELYEYNTDTRKLTRISRGEEGTPFSTAEGGVAVGEDDSKPIVAEDGSAVYFKAEHKLTGSAFEKPGGLDLYRYDTVNNTIRFIAAVAYPTDQGEGAYATPNGEFDLFSSVNVAGEQRGEGRNELYRYDNADGSMICVSCGTGTTPPPGYTHNETEGGSVLQTGDDSPKFVPMSEDGSRVFFQTTERLVARDTNSTEGSGQDIYEWEAEGTEEAPGVFCREANGCTHLISSGNDENTSVLLGASRDGSNVFFETSARLVPQDTDDLPDFYDARIDGGFAAPGAPVRCSGESCRLIPSASPLISTPLSATFSGAGNITAKPVVKPRLRAQKLADALKACRKAPKKRRAACQTQARKRYGAKAVKSTKRGDR